MSSSPPALRRVAFVCRGRVQGVAFRAYTKRAADRNAVSGWVRNREDGAVEGEAQGPATGLDAFIEFLHTGPALARVDAVELTDRPSIEVDDGFTVRR